MEIEHIGPGMVAYRQTDEEREAEIAERMTRIEARLSPEQEAFLRRRLGRTPRRKSRRKRW